MRKRILLLICLFVPPYVYGDVNCSGHDGDATGCWRIPGCQYFDVTDVCQKCTPGKYCNGQAYNCPTPFTESAPGAGSYTDCYTTVTCGSNSGIKINPGDCDVSSGEANCLMTVYGNTDTPTTFIQYNYDENPSPKKFIHFIPIDTAYVIVHSDVWNDYHLEIIPIFDNGRIGTIGSGHLTGTFWLPGEYKIQCFPNNLDCSDFSRNFTEDACSDKEENQCDPQNGCFWGGDIYKCLDKTVGVSKKEL